MSRWSQRVRAALTQSTVREGIAQLATAWMSEHIEEGRGRAREGAFMGQQGGPNGAPYRALKPLFGRRWTTSRPKNGASKTRTRTVYGKNGKMRQVTEYLVEQAGYRNGGQPLRNTGSLLNSVNAVTKSGRNGLRITMRGNGYGRFQDAGFVTSGPNYIPLTKNAARKRDSKSARSAGLMSGSDFLRAKRGVRVPARPFILPTRNDLTALGKNIHLGLRAILKGT